jgi:transposase-like protein
MNIHTNARLAPHSRAELARRLLEEGQAPKAVATVFSVSPKTVVKWVERFKAEGPRFFFRSLCHQGLGDDEQGCHRSGILQDMKRPRVREALTSRVARESAGLFAEQPAGSSLVARGDRCRANSAVG